MTAEGGEARTAPTLVRGWFGKLGFHQIWQLGVAVILAATALFGGLDTVNNKVTPIKAGEPFADGEFTITIQRASALREVRAGSMVVARRTPGRRYLAVAATVRNDGTTPGMLRDEVDLRDMPGSEFVDTFRIADGSEIASLGPGLTETVAFIWKVPEEALQPGSSVTLRVWRKKYQELAVNYGKGWIDSIDQYGEIRLPVKVTE